MSDDVAALDKARERARQAFEALGAARAAAAEPSTADLDTMTLLRIWMLSWPWRLEGAAEGTQPKLTGDELAVIRFLACRVIEQYGWISDDIVKMVEPMINQKIAETINRGGTVQAKDAAGHVITLARVPNLPAGSTILSTVAHGR